MWVKVISIGEVFIRTLLTFELGTKEATETYYYPLSQQLVRLISLPMDGSRNLLGGLTLEHLLPLQKLLLIVMIC